MLAFSLAATARISAQTNNSRRVCAEPHLVVYIVYLGCFAERRFAVTLQNVSLTWENHRETFTLTSTHFIHRYQRQAGYFTGFLCLNLNLLSLLNTARSAVAPPPLAALIKGVFVFQTDGGFQTPVVFCLSTYFSSLSLTTG